MPSPAWMPLYVADYLADTQHLSTLQHGAYLLLLMAYWRTGPLPGDDVLLARVTKLGLKGWRRERETLAGMFSIAFESGREVWHHKRVDAEREKALGISEKRQAAAKARHSPSKSMPDADAHGSQGRDANAEQLDAYARPRHSHNQKERGIGENEKASAKPDAEALWGPGLAWLVERGVAEGKARSCIGRWIKDHGEAVTVAAMRRAFGNRPAEPIAWINGALKNGGSANGSRSRPTVGADYRAGILAGIARTEDMAAGGAGPGDGGPLDAGDVDREDGAF